MNSLPLAHTSWLKPFVEFFAERDTRLEPYLETAQIPFALVYSGEGWITKHQLYSFLNEIAECERMPELGFVVGERITPDYLGTIGTAMAGAASLGDALQIFCRLVPRHVEENQVWVEEGDDGEIWLFNKTEPRLAGIGDLADHAGLMSLINLVRLAAGGDWAPRQATLQAAPTEAFRKIPSLRDCQLEFCCEATGAAFPARLLLQPILVTAGQNPERNLLRGDETVPDRLKIVLAQIIGIGGILPSVRLAAELAGTSTRTLHRRLREAGTTYQELLDEIRFDRARALLLTSDSTIKEIAAALGYSGSNNFVRAFTRLSGMTPAVFREKESNS